jgi:predicted secreted protein
MNKILKYIVPGSQQVNGIYKRYWENTTDTEEKFTQLSLCQSLY